MANFSRFVRKLENAKRYMETEAVPEAAQELKATIRGLSHIGIGADGEKFKPYTPAYERWRKKRGLRTDTVDLRVTGDMLDRADLYTVGGEHVLMPSAEDMPKALGNHAIRKFFAAGDVAVKRVTRKIEQGLRKRLA